jgi:hypothetical protein
VVNLYDIMPLVWGFQGNFSRAPLEACDVWPCTLNGVVNLDDIMAVIRAWIDQTYAAAGCSAPCP